MPTAQRCRFLAYILLLACAPAQALTYLVGGGAVPSECDTNSLQAAIDAAAANPGEDFIRVASDQSYTGIALSIGQQDLTITGGYASCGAALPVGAVPTGSTTLDGAGGAAAPVVAITGSGVRVLQSLQLRNGDNVQAGGTGCGGGIRFDGRGELVLRNIGIGQNQANSGGGVCFRANGTPAALSVQAFTSINNNTATTGHGGGILIAGTARLFLLEDNTLVAFNRALNGIGGGIYVNWPARSDIGSPGVGALGVLYANEAQRGGGFAAVAPEGSDGNVCTRFFSTDAARPVRIQQNRASSVGGAIYARSNTGLSEYSTAIVRAYDFRIDGNSAPNGPAVFLEGDETFDNLDRGSTLHLNTSAFDQACNESLADLGRVPCTQPAVCNRIEGNVAQDFNGQPTNGNVIESRDDSLLYADYVTFSGNAGTRLLSWSSGDLMRMNLTNCALVDNTLTQELFRGFNAGVLLVSNCTIAGNSIGGAGVLAFDDDEGELELFNSVIEQPGLTTLLHPDVGLDTVTNQWIVASDTASLRPDPTLLAAPARFQDPARGNYRLRIGSQAVDFVPGTPSEGLDLDRRNRGVDLGDDSANTRTRDAGAFERQVNDPWLLNGDFVTDLHLWTVLDPAHATWTGAFNAPGSVGGSLSFSIPAANVGPADRRAAVSQCFNVPFGGDYAVTGRALVSGVTGLSQDYPLVHWRLRYGEESCLGPADASGERFFGRSSSTWQPLASPLVIPVDPAQWTWNTTIEIILEAAQNQSSPTATGLFARFDEIEILRLPSGPGVFADGFED